MTTTPKDPVGALMELVVDLEQAAHAGASFPRILSMRAAVEASARALAAVPAVEPVGEVVDMKYNSVRFYRKPNDPAAPYLQPGTKLYTAPIAQQAGGVPSGWQRCPACNGKGDSASGMTTCGGCHGSGRVAAPSPSAGQPLDSVKVPTTADEAALMTLMGMEWLKEHAPERLKPSAVQPLTDEQVRKWWASENGLEDLDMCNTEDFRTMVRAVEKKHGIVAPKEPT